MKSWMKKMKSRHLRRFLQITLNHHDLNLVYLIVFVIYIFELIFLNLVHKGHLFIIYNYFLRFLFHHLIIGFIFQRFLFILIIVFYGFFEVLFFLLLKYWLHHFINQFFLFINFFRLKVVKFALIITILVIDLLGWVTSFLFLILIWFIFALRFSYLIEFVLFNFRLLWCLYFFKSPIFK